MKVVNKIWTSGLTFSPCSLPLFCSSVSAGFPSPAENYLEGQLDLNEHLIARPSSTFFVRVSGNSMMNAGILDQDLLIVDRSLEAKSGNIILAILHGEFTIKRLVKKSSSVYLYAENPSYKPIVIQPEMDFQVWGVVIHAIHSL